MIDQTNRIQEIGKLDQNVIVHDISYDWNGKRIAAACSDKEIKIYERKGVEGWSKQKVIKIQGASVWKVKWARPEFGVILATCSLDHLIRIYQLKSIQKHDSDRSQWISIHNIQENKSVDDIKFAPNKQLGLCLAIATSDGYLKILTAQDPLKLRQWGTPIYLLINDLGLNCLSWSKNLLKEEQCLIVVGCKNIDTTPKKVLNGMKNGINEEPYKLQNANTLIFVTFNKNLGTKQLSKLSNSVIKQTVAINDVSWALMNGRSYYLLAVASDNYLKIFELNINDNMSISTSIEVIRQIKLLDQVCYRLSWNVMGTYISGSEKKKITIWRNFSRGNWNQVKEIQQC